ncbi:non-ribosomal peptide synthetase [Amycolatopsis ultiminotia]|uniref:Non-ribosomal peptide synthetase n=1 Tax=Amycolatopsis ultiminotia TaxID=543629 RepID=A0ABP6YHG9_9PSEU
MLPPTETTSLMLTHAQRDLWHMPARDTRVVAQYLEITGPFDLARFEISLRRLVSEAECLRVRFTGESGRVRQQLLSTVHCPLTVVDLRAHPETAVEHVAGILERPFDPAVAPLFGYTVLRLADNRHWWVQCYHPLVADEYTVAMLARRAAEIHYGDGPSPFLPLSRLVEEDAHYGYSPQSCRDRRFWAEYTAGWPEPAGLSTTPPAPASAPARRPLRQTAVLPRRIADETAGTVAAFAGFLFRMTGLSDQVLGLQVTARRTAAAKATPGRSAITVPLRLQLDRRMTVPELVTHVSDRMNSVLAHHNHRTPPDRLFHTSLSVLPEPGESALGTAHHRYGCATGELSLTVAGPEITLEANPLRYTEDDLSDLNLRLQRYLAGYTALGGRPIQHADVLTPAERHRLLVGWNPGHHEDPTGTLADAFALRAAEHADRVAVTGEDGDLTYRELAARANRLARVLISRGIGPGQVVGLALSRPTETITAMLAAILAGAAYRPSVTGEDDASTCVVLTSSDTSWTDLETAADAPVLDAERTRPLTAAAPACVHPGGALVAHRNVLHLFAATASTYEFRADDVWITAGFPLWETWGSLLHGARLVLASRGDFFRRAAQEGVTVLSGLPEKTHPALRVVTVDGPTLDPVRLAGWYDRHPEDCPLLVSRYGSAETTGHATQLALTREDCTSGDGSPIGRGIGDLRVYLLDDALEPAPPGRAGEMYLAGPGVADGYLDQPARSASRFVACPFGEPGEHMYRSGDLARWTADGCLRYLGPAVSR